MKNVMFGVFAAGAVASMIGTAAMAETAGTATTTDAKACYRKECGKSIDGYPGKCGGTKVVGLSDQQACEKAGGAWTTEADAAQYKH